MAVLARNRNVPHIRDEPIAWLNRLQVGAKMVRKLIQDDLTFLRFILAPGGFAMKHGFSTRWMSPGSN